MTINRPLTIDWRLARQHDDNQLKPSVRVLEIAEHRFHLVGIGCILTEARLAHDRHAGVR